jgi:hypothetical protein
MRNVFLIAFFGLFSLCGFAQISSFNTSGGNSTYQSDTTQYRKERKITIDGETNYKDYKIISINNDTTIVDTTLTIEKQYKFNFLRKDNFELMEFANQGQTFNNLGYSFYNSNMLPAIGFNAKQFSYYTLDDIYYYYVPTPTSELMYRKGMKQGQVLDALLTANTSRQFNISVAFKGLNSLGQYQNSQSKHSSFRTTFNYHTKNKRYYIRGHFYSYKIGNEQNGGLPPQSLEYFETNNPNYTDRSRLEVNFTDADNTLEGKRYYLDQVVTLFSNRSFEKNTSKKQLKTPVKIDTLHRRRPIHPNDSLKLANNFVLKDTLQPPVKLSDSIALTSVIHVPDTIITGSKLQKQLFNLQLGNSLLYETEYYRFNQTTANSYFGDSFESSVQDHTSYQTFNGELYLQLYSVYTGSVKFKFDYFTYNYHYNSILYYDDYTIGDKIKGNTVAIGAEWVKTFGNLQLTANAATIVGGNLHGNTLKTGVTYKMDSLFNFQAYAEFTSKAPDFNKQLYQSDYIDFNWQNNFGNEKITTFGGTFNTQKWGSVAASYNVVDNYTYFNESSLPEQADETLNYFKIKLSKQFTYGKFSLDNTVQFQKVLSGESFFKVPNWITRNTLYYSTDVFKGDPLYLQTGITFSYFSNYQMNAYNPLISEFYLQDTELIGNFPLLEFFVNFRIQRTRFYLQLENFSSGFTGRDYFSAPTYPYRDLTFRIGLVWNFFI